MATTTTGERFSQAERIYVLHGAQQDMREDGRATDDYRPLVVDTHVLAGCAGSARARMGGTDVLVGAKAEVEATADDCGRLVFAVDCSATATPAFEGKGGDDLSSDVVNALDAAYSGVSADLLRRLCLVPKHHAWTVYLDLVLLECGDVGNVFDVASLAVKAALLTTRLPLVKVTYNEKQEPEVELQTEVASEALQVDCAPLLVSVSKLGTADCIDVTAAEAQCALACLVVGVLPPAEDQTEARVSMAQMYGRGSLEPDSIGDMTMAGVRMGTQLHEKLDEHLKKTQIQTS